MTDNEIVKALECCIKDDCDNCPDTFGNCEHNAMRNALDLINRQKAEIEMLREGIRFERERVNAIPNLIKNAKPEAIKEFAERLKERVVSKYDYTDIRVFKELDNLVKEMTEVQE